MDYKIPERLRELRLSKKLTQQALAEYIGLRPNSIARFETGNGKPSLDTLVRIALFFHVSVDYLIGISDDSEININSNNATIEKHKLSDEAIIDKLETMDKLLSEIRERINN